MTRVHWILGILMVLAWAIATPPAQAEFLFVANFDNNTVSEVTPSGSVSTFASGFSSPVGLAFQPEIAPPSAVPEPSSLTLLALGLVTLAGSRWRRRKLAPA